MNNLLFSNKLRSVFLFFFLFFWSASACSEDSLTAHYFNAGYGDAAIIDLPGDKIMMIDAGPNESSDDLIRYLKEYSITSVDAAIITHPHKNHFEGFFKVLDHAVIKRVYINGDQNMEEGYSELLDFIKEKHVPVDILKEGDELNLDIEGLSIKFLHPANLDSSPNNNSIVTWLEYKNSKFLFFADVEEAMQERIIEAFPEILGADCVSIPHHGGPLNEKFIERFKNKIFIVSTGENPWGLPHEDSLSRLQGTVLRTDKIGTIRVQTDGETMEVINGNP